MTRPLRALTARSTTIAALALVAVQTIAACAGQGSASSAPDGGAAASGGREAATGGAAGLGGAPGSGGAVGSGGAATGGNTASGGSSASGGRFGSGGAPGSGGTAGGSGGAAGQGTGGAATGTGGATTATGGSTVQGKLAAKPYMGWSSWSFLQANPTETKIKAITDAMATTLLSYWYEYINIDDGWMSGIDANGRWKTNTQRIPSGFKGLADYVHSKGMKIGIYLVPGVLDAAYDANSPIEGTSYKVKDISTTAYGNTNRKESSSHKIDYSKPGAVEFIEGHAKLLASWGVDFVKMDFVGPGGGSGACDNQEDIKRWRAALDKSGRQIWLELSNKLDISAISTWKGYSNGWRVASDIEVFSGKRTDWAHVLREIQALPPFVQHAGSGHWNDLDSTEIGNGDMNGITPTERQTHFSYWAINCAPIYLGTDPTAMDPDDLKILQNREIIAVHQAGIPAKPVSTSSTSQVWYSKQADGSIVVGLFNFGDGSATVTATFSAVGAANTVMVRDLVSQTELGASTGSFSGSLPAHGSRMLKLTP